MKQESSLEGFSVEEKEVVIWLRKLKLSLPCVTRAKELKLQGVKIPTPKSLLQQTDITSPT